MDVDRFRWGYVLNTELLIFVCIHVAAHNPMLVSLFPIVVNRVKIENRWAIALGDGLSLNRLDLKRCHNEEQNYQETSKHLNLLVPILNCINCPPMIVTWFEMSITSGRSEKGWPCAGPTLSQLRTGNG